MGYRISAIIGVLALVYAALIVKVYDIQIIHGSSYQAEAAQYDEIAGLTTPQRGDIYFVDNAGDEIPAAINKDFPILYADPQTIAESVKAGKANLSDIAQKLAFITGSSESVLQRLISAKSSVYVPLLHKASADQVNAAVADQLPGIDVGQEVLRFYPLGSVASQVLGFVGPNSSGSGSSGHYGIEGYYNDILSGSAAAVADGRDSPDVVLTIDPNIQMAAEKIVSDLVTSNNATGGSFIVEDPQTGKILAMGSVPDFNPNDYASSSLADFMNPNVQSVYEPGSIMKVITMSAGIDSGKITPDTTYDDKGYVNVSKAHITNYNLTTHGPYGPGTTMTQVIEHSINTGAIWAENQTGNDTFLSYLKKFGLDQKTGIDLPGEVNGDLSQLNPKSPQIDWDTAAYGQGAAVSPIELVDAVSAIANGGTLMRPYINAALQPQTIRRVISTSTAEQVTQMMVDAVDLAQVANINGYSLAGKTGSAFIPNPAGGGYLDKLTDSYIGFGPTSNPRFVAFIRLNTIPVTSLAAETVVPAWQKLAQYITNYYNIPPDRTTSDVIPNCRDLICGQ
ncbi:MAG: penicillin-binding protein 2 [Patescibacteria group bacterium]|nr:penicillin-binding protein 2 [Patescibacteria group bacterium]MCL5224444.1 penicillin-binding protein 2 [Patescibacteria group bacterium]